MRNKIDDSVWLLSLAIILALLGFIIPTSQPAAWILLVGLIGGCIYALTNVNDRRIVKGRKDLYDEPELLSAPDLLALGGMFGIVTTWLLLPVAYLIFVGHQFPEVDASWSSLAIDTYSAFTSPAVLGTVSIPLGFLWAGIFTLLSTLA